MASSSEHEPVPGISFAVSMSLSASSSNSSMRSSTPSELPSLVVPNGASAVQPVAISHWQCSTKRSASGPPSSPKGVRTGAMTPENVAFFCICGTLVRLVFSSSRHGDAGLPDGHVVTFNDGGPDGDRLIPAQHVWIFVQVHRVPLKARDPGPSGHIGDRVGPREVFNLGEAPVEHAVKAMGLLDVALLRVD